jgi:glucokinase
MGQHMTTDADPRPTDGDVVAALDVGGTAIKSALTTAAGVEVLRTERETPVSAGVDVVVDAIVSTVAEMRARADLDVVGVGLVFPGVVEAGAGVARYSANIGWRDLPIRDIVSERVGLPVAIEHDVRAGGLAELRIGAARGISEALFLAIGTGIAGAIITGGRVIAGPTAMAGEIGHIPVVPDGELCACGQRGCTENYASAAALPRRYRRLAGLPGTAPVNAEDVIALARKGDQAATRVFDDAVTVLGRALVIYTLLMDPELIVVGGGLANAGHALLGPIAEQLRQGLVWRNAPPLRLAHFGAAAGRIGAALIGWSAWEEQQ